MSNTTQQPFTPPYDLMDVDDVLGSYPSLTAAERLTLKLGSASGEHETRQHLEPLYTQSLRALRREGLAEARLNERLRDEAAQLP